MKIYLLPEITILLQQDYFEQDFDQSPDNWLRIVKRYRLNSVFGKSGVVLLATGYFQIPVLS